jgi:hypothetical protein
MKIYGPLAIREIPHVVDQNQMEAQRGSLPQTGIQRILYDHLQPGERSRKSLPRRTILLQLCWFIYAGSGKRTSVWKRKISLQLWYGSDCTHSHRSTRHMKILEGIGNTLGSFVRITEATLQGRYTSYTWICVYLNVSKALPTSICLRYRDVDWLQTLDYEHIPFRCRKFHAHGNLF